MERDNFQPEPEIDPYDWEKLDRLIFEARMYLWWKENMEKELSERGLTEKLQNYDLETIHEVIVKHGFPEDDFDEWMKHFDEIEPGPTPT